MPHVKAGALDTMVGKNKDPIDLVTITLRPFVQPRPTVIAYSSIKTG